jgi:diamine N-acetyltransferase
MKILLKEINKDNWYACTCLRVAENQKNFVATNAFSLAQSKYEQECIPLAIYDEETMIGFVMFAIDKDQIESGKLWICRFMVDEKFQGKGYGKASMDKIIEYAKDKFDYKEVYLSEVPENVRAKRIYESFGFKYTGEVEDSEEVMVLKLR